MGISVHLLIPWLLSMHTTVVGNIRTVSIQIIVQRDPNISAQSDIPDTSKYRMRKGKGPHLTPPPPPKKKQICEQDLYAQPS